MEAYECCCRNSISLRVRRKIYSSFWKFTAREHCVSQLEEPEKHIQIRITCKISPDVATCVLLHKLMWANLKPRFFLGLKRDDVSQRVQQNFVVTAALYSAEVQQSPVSCALRRDSNIDVVRVSHCTLVLAVCDSINLVLCFRKSVYELTKARPCAEFLYREF